MKVSWFTRNEVPRKVLHGSIAILTTILYLNGVQSQQVTPWLIAAIIPICILEFLRFASPTFNRMYIAVVGHLMRKEEKEEGRVNGVIWYLAGLIIVFSFFPKDVCLTSVFLLSWADLAASTLGRAFGHHSFKLVGQKSFIGTLAAFLTGVISTVVVYEILLPLRPDMNPPNLILYNSHLSQVSVTRLSLVMGLTVAVAELFPIIDDNFSIPIVCAIVQTLYINHYTLPYTYGVFR